MSADAVAHSPFDMPESMRIVRELRAAEFHWHFSQGFEALSRELYVPGVLSLITGIEGSIRFTLYQRNSNIFPFSEELGAVLSNSLLRVGNEAGLPVATLAFSGEVDFISSLASKRPEVRIVKIRNDLAHGNIQSFVNRDLGDDQAFFTPECLRPLAEDLIQVSRRWMVGLANYRTTTQP
jgi:hypothetical protein